MTFISTYLIIGAIIMSIVAWTSDFFERVDVNNFMDVLATIIVFTKVIVLWPYYVLCMIKKGISNN